MRIESKEEIFRLFGEPLFRGGERFHWKKVIFPEGLAILVTGNGRIIKAPQYEIFLEEPLKENPFSIEGPVKNAQPPGQIYKPKAIPMVTN